MPTQAERSAATQRKLLDVAEELFAAHPFNDITADEIVAKAGLTRGALQHHFKDKTGLFQAAYEDMAQRFGLEFQKRVPEAGALERLQFTLGFLFDICEQPGVARIMLVEAPAALGWDKWRELEERYVLGLLIMLCAEGVDSGVLIDASPHTVATVLFGAVIEAELIIAHAPARREGEHVVVAILSGMLRKPGAEA